MFNTIWVEGRSWIQRSCMDLFVMLYLWFQTYIHENWPTFRSALPFHNLIFQDAKSTLSSILLKANELVVFFFCSNDVPRAFYYFLLFSDSLYPLPPRIGNLQCKTGFCSSKLSWALAYKYLTHPYLYYTD